MDSFDKAGGVTTCSSSFGIPLVPLLITHSVLFSFLINNFQSWLSEYEDGGGPPEIEVEDNRPLMERIGDKVMLRDDLQPKN